MVADDGSMVVIHSGFMVVINFITKVHYSNRNYDFIRFHGDLASSSHIYTTTIKLPRWKKVKGRGGGRPVVAAAAAVTQNRLE